MKDQIEFIKQAHEGQIYKPDKPYFYHLDQTARVGQRFSCSYPFLMEEDIQLACYGHDILEDTKTTAQDLQTAGFSERTIDIIKRVTDEPGANRKERKAATYPKIKGNIEATAVKLCDRIANVEYALQNKNYGHINMYAREEAEFEFQCEIPGQLDDMWGYLKQLFTYQKELR